MFFHFQCIIANDPDVGGPIVTLVHDRLARVNKLLIIAG